MATDDSPVTAAARKLAQAKDRARRKAMGPPLRTPTDAQLDALAAVGPQSADSAEALWDEAQRAAKTGLVGLLSADAVTDG